MLVLQWLGTPSPSLASVGAVPGQANPLQLTSTGAVPPCLPTQFSLHNVPLPCIDADSYYNCTLIIMLLYVYLILFVPRNALAWLTANLRTSLNPRKGKALVQCCKISTPNLHFSLCTALFPLTTSKSGKHLLRRSPASPIVNLKSKQ